jgi:uncharacterized protein YpbB
MLAAYNYFFEKLDAQLFQLLYKIEEVKRIKLVKQFFEELSVLEDLQTKAVIRLMKAKNLIEIVLLEADITKENLNTSEIKNYKEKKVQIVWDVYKAKNFELIETQKSDSFYEPKKKKTEKTAKKPTTQITYELWVEKNSIAEIAALRTLNESTILGHFIKLIQDKAVKIEDVLPSDKLQELAKVFTNYAEETLSPLKEKHGSKFSWEELRMYKASLNV